VNYMDHLVQVALDAPADQGPVSPRDLAAHQIAMAVRGAYEATSELVRLRCDPVAGPLVGASEGELWAILARVQLLVSEIRAEAEGPRLRVV
jgi:hypothetical protein